MWKRAIKYRALSIASITAVPGERGRFWSVGLGLGEESWAGDATETEGERWIEGVLGVGWERGVGWEE